MAVTSLETLPNCTVGWFRCKFVSHVVVVTPKSTTVRDSSSEKLARQLKLERIQSCVQQTVDLQLLAGLFLPVGLRKSCPSLWEREACQLYLITVWGLVTGQRTVRLELEMFLLPSIYILYRVREATLHAELIPHCLITARRLAAD